MSNNLLIAVILGVVIVIWLGTIIYPRLKLRFGSGPYGRCRYCNSVYRGNLTYCPRCSEVVASGSSRR